MSVGGRAGSRRSRSSLLGPSLSPYHRLSLPRGCTLFRLFFPPVSSLLPSPFSMRAAAKQCALSVSVSQSLPVCISGLRLARPSSGQESAPTVFWLDLEAVGQGLGGPGVHGPTVPRWHGGAVVGNYASRLKRLVAAATMATRGRPSGECLPPVRVRRLPVGRPFIRSIARSVGRSDQSIAGLAGERAGRSGERGSVLPWAGK
jgi:hypothetical protein